MRVAVVAFSPLAGDSRVQRTAAALAEAGHTVLLVGHGPAPAVPGCEIALLPEPPPPWRIRAGILLRQGPATLLPATASALYWASTARLKARAILRAWRPDAVHANDWNTLPLALDARRGWGARIVYDAHEMAVAEYEESLKWRLAALAHVRAIEARGIAAADAVITVSPGIAEALAEIYPGIAPPQVIRNLPDVEPAPFRPTGETVDILFHGLMRPNRGIEPLIEALPRLRPDFRLVLRGNGAPAYLEALRQQAQALGVAGRIRFEPAVAPAQVVRAAAGADLGAVILPDTSRHNRFALPNKLFEYIAAGLGVVVSDVPDMAAIVGEAGCGLIAPPDGEAIAAVLNRLDHAAIDALKRRSVAAAPGLTWSGEKRRLAAIYDGLAARP